MHEKLIENVFMRFGDLLYNTDVIEQLKYWRKVSLLNEREINDLSESNLQRLLYYAVDSIPFYSNVKISGNTDSVSMLADFPVMHKEDVKSNTDLLIKGDKRNLIKYSSSGSSGIQGTVYMNKKEESVIRAIMLLWWEWAGYKLGKTTLQTGMTTDRGILKSLKDLILNIDYFSAFGLSDREILHLLKRYQSKKGCFLAGYPSSLNAIAEIAIKNSINDVNFDAAICWGDKLFEHYKKNIKHVFGTEVKEVYSSNEGFLVGAKKDLDYFYIMSPHVHVEIVDKNGMAVPDGQLGYVLLTRLDSFSMPLIRYYVGDLAIKLPREKYPDKREMHFPLLEKVIGRDTDIVYTTSGKYLIVHFFTGIFEYVPEIRQFRVIQRELSSIEIEYIPAENFEYAIIQKVERIIKDKIKDDLRILWKQVDQIPPTPSGKPQLIQSFINKAEV